MFPQTDAPHFLLVVLLSALLAIPVHRAMSALMGVRLRAVAKLLVVFSSIAIVGAKLGSLVVDGMSGPLYGVATDRFRYPGAIVLLLITIPLWYRFKPRQLSLLGCIDLLVPGTCVALAVIRIDCLIAGCCAGGICTLPWAIHYPITSNPWFHQVKEGLISASAPWSLGVHPLPIYFAVLALAVGLFLLRFAPRKAYDGQLVLLFLAIHETAKFLLEFLRYPRIGSLQLVSLAVAVCALLILALREALVVRGRAKEEVRPV